VPASDLGESRVESECHGCDDEKCTGAAVFDCGVEHCALLILAFRHPATQYTCGEKNVVKKVFSVAIVSEFGMQLESPHAFA
jgi:hypothetical protein